MKKLAFLLITFSLTSCIGNYEVSTTYLDGKIFEKKGFAEDQISPDEAKANPEFAKQTLTTLATITFVDQTTITASYWHYSQETITTSGTYVIKDNKIRVRFDDINSIFGRNFELKDAEHLTSDGQLNAYELKK
ncbi:hypothetical protein [Olleya sp. Bg11-27]|uniref:hypothetical protein n=1 Tax=Olleya sp. Bg11-27 TaxID=2058135 RepID=UPI000C315DFC|nr:hypothetical protein [Olleya sp. Bg11-27]AUC76176.1 hypothetical protein CW732_11075 [Olleya sp. Bg11-27]